MNVTPHVDLAFAVRGHTVPRDHGYALYGALSRLIPSIHGGDWIAIHGISGMPLDKDALGLRPKGVLRVRVPLEKLTDLLVLTGSLRLDASGR